MRAPCDETAPRPPLPASPHGDRGTDQQLINTPLNHPYFRDSNDKDGKRNWSSSTNLAPAQDKRSNSTDFGNPSSWTSTPDLANLEDDTQANIPTVSLTLPKRKQKPIDASSRTGTPCDSCQKNFRKSSVTISLAA